MNMITVPPEAIHTGELILVNQAYPYEGNRERQLAPVKKSCKRVLMEYRAAGLLATLMKGLDNWKEIAAVSGFRSEEEQEEIFTQSVTENGLRFTKKYVAQPGHSEHQTGLAIDLALNGPDIDFISPNFPYSGICETFRRRCRSFGFIERYPQNKESITGIGHEPWHFRYVGKPHAAIMDKNGATLEEYLAYIKEFPHGEKGLTQIIDDKQVVISYLAADRDKETKCKVNQSGSYSISGNNMDGFIVTAWKN